MSKQAKFAMKGNDTLCGGSFRYGPEKDRNFGGIYAITICEVLSEYAFKR